jgi:hypothetical protein
MGNVIIGTVGRAVGEDCVNFFHLLERGKEKVAEKHAFTLQRCVPLDRDAIEGCKKCAKVTR